MHDTHPDWAPSLLLGHSEVKVTNENRFARRLRRHERSGIRTGQQAESWVQSEVGETTPAQQEEVTLTFIFLPFSYYARCAYKIRYFYCHCTRLYNCTDQDADSMCMKENKDRFKSNIKITYTILTY